MTLIVLEGGDGSGKTEQAKRLFERLQNEKYKAQFFDFPRYYESRAGKLIGELLAGKHGDFMSMPPQISSLPYTLDRVSAKPDLDKALSEEKIIVCNRYTPSNLAHQSAKLPKDERKEFVEFLEGLEYDELKIPKPTLVIYLSVPTDISSELIGRKSERGYITDGAGRDNAERNITHQDRTRVAYLSLAESHGWEIINCAPNGMLRTIDDIHDEVWEVVKKHLTM